MSRTWPWTSSRASSTLVATKKRCYSPVYTTEEGSLCSAREVLKEFIKSGVRVAWPRLADLLFPPPMAHRILKKHRDSVDENESLTEVLVYWENNDQNHTWNVLCLALLSDRDYKELGASLYSKHVKPEEFTVDLVYEEIKDLTDDHLEIAYVLVENSKRLREIWGDDADKLSFEERTKRVIDHWMKNNPASSWLLLAKRLDCSIHGEREIAAQELAVKIREKYIPKVEERSAYYGPPEGFSEGRKILKEFSAQEAFKELTAVEDWFGLGWFLKVEEKELKEIEERHGRDDVRKLHMLEKWVETQPKTASWNNLAFTLKKMPQHQSLAEDIEEKLAMQKQAEIRDKNLRSLYTDHFFSRLVESLCDDQTRSSLIDQLASLSLISETDKKAQLSSTLRDPRQRAVSLLLFLNIEEKPQKLIDLMRAMSNVDKMKSLVDEMFAQYNSMEGPSDPSDQYLPPPPAMENTSEQYEVTSVVQTVQHEGTIDTSEKSVQATEDISEKSTQAMADISEKSTQATVDTSEKSTQYEALNTRTIPTLLKLTSMKRIDGTSIVQNISANDYITFGMHLLQDENGTIVEVLKIDNIKEGIECVTRAILKKWLTSDAAPRTYEHFIMCLRQSEMGALAEDIAEEL